MTVEDFIELCRERGFHFTANWVQRRYNELCPVRKITASSLVDQDEPFAGPFR